MSKKVAWFAPLALGLILVLTVPALANAQPSLILWGDEPYGGEDFRLVIGGIAGSNELTILSLVCPLGEGTWLEGQLLKEGAFSLCLANNQVFAGGIHLEAVFGNRLVGGTSPALMIGLAEETHPAKCIWSFIRYYPVVYDLETRELLDDDAWSVGIRIGTERFALILGGRDGFTITEWFARLEASPIKELLLVLGYDESGDLQVGCGLSI